MRSLRDRLEDMLQAIEAIESVAVRGKEAFSTDPMIQVWMIHHIQIIGEAVRAVSDELKQRRSGIRWAEIAGMRSILVHDYFGIDLDEVWGVVEKDIPLLKPEVVSLLLEIGESLN